MTCGACGEALVAGSTFKCNKCGSQNYCSKLCQKKHWPEHKAQCIAPKENGKDDKSKQCHYCKRTDVPVQTCGRCKERGLTRYCSRKCQLADWPSHKKICKNEKKDARPKHLAVVAPSGETAKQRLERAEAHIAAQLQRCNMALARVKKMGDRPAEMWAHIQLGQALVRFGQHDKALPPQHAGMAIAQELQHQEGLLRAHDLLGQIQAAQGQYQEALVNLNHALTIAKEIKDSMTLSQIYVNITSLYHSLGQSDAANQACQNAVQNIRNMKDQSQEMRMMHNLGSILVQNNEFEKAVPLFEEMNSSLLKPSSSDLMQLKAAALDSLAICYQNTRCYDKAQQIITQTLTLAQKNGERHKEAGCYVNLGAVYAKKKDFTEAMKHYDKAEVLAIELGDKHLLRTLFSGLALCATELGDNEASLAAAQKVLNLSLEAGDRRREGSCYLSMGATYGKMDMPDETIEYYCKAQRVAFELGDFILEKAVYNNLAVALKGFGLLSEANQFAALSQRIGPNPAGPIFPITAFPGDI
eukprot:gb/GEZN01005501.1/.p1 GENE.gb/GEZN01005501.1/~~gb/GEZN01005501.1/.p1  ORF type:complete len:527 (+),score=85.54 gb/GEZN01005501.1/:114-1694(+)